MPPLAAQARVTARGEKNPHVGFEDPIENRAWAVWFRIRTGKVRVTGVPAKGPANKGLEQVDGFEVEVNMSTKIRDTWPAEVGAMDPQSRAAYAGEIRSFLNVSGNAICLRSPGIGSGDHGQPQWWIRGEWNDVKGIPTFRQTELTRTEQRLTPEEAGETRPPAPVAVRNGPPPTPAKKAAPTAQNEAQRTTVVSQRDRVLKFVRDAKEPVYQREVVRALQINTIDTGRVLRTLVKENVLFRRYETKQERPADLNGRFRYLYWDKPVVPQRQTPMDNKSVAMDLVSDLKPGDRLRISWMANEDKAEIKEMIEADLLEADGPDFVKLAADKPPIKTGLAAVAPDLPAMRKPEPAPDVPKGGPAYLATPEREPTPATQAAVQPAIKSSLEGVMTALSELIEAQVRAGIEATVGDLQSQLDEEKAARARAEQHLIQAQTELSALRRRSAQAAEALRLLT